MRDSLQERLLLALAPPLAGWVIRLLYLAQRREVLGQERLEAGWAAGERFIFCFWHDQLLLLIRSYRGPGARILISASRDGELIARTMKRFGHDAIRGSSSRGGRTAFRRMVGPAVGSWDLAVTPDGPRGPRHEVKPGVAELARVTGRAVVPLAMACSRGHRFASWDRFLLPLPGGRAVFRYGEPLRPAAGEDREAFRERIRRAMDENQRLATARLEESGVSAV